MSFNIKTWVDRISEYPNRRRLTKEDNTQEVVTVERYEGDIATTGDKFNADTMNDLEERIDNAIRGIDSSAIKNITRSGTTFTATRLDNTTFTFTQQDTVYTLPTANGSTLGGIKVGSNLNINNGVLSAKDASTSQAGYMSAADKTKLNGIQASANNIKTTLGTQSITVAASGGNVTITHNKPSGTILACIPCGITAPALHVSGPQDSSLSNMKAGKFYIANTSNASVTGTMHVLWIYY